MWTRWNWAMLAVFGNALAGGIHLRGVLTDAAFPPPGPYRLEVLETGDTLRVTPGRNFSLALQPDTLWTLCLRQGDSAGAFEKCFEVRRHEPDSLFSVELAGPGLPLTPMESGVIATSPSAAADSPGGVAQEQAGDAETESVRLQKVVLRAQRIPKRAMGRQTVSAKLIKRMPGLAEADVIRSIQGLPGVVSSSDFSTKIYVRGGGSDQNLILFDNAVVYSPVHFFGLFSTFLVNGIEDVTFYKGGFAPEYGNRLSSVLDVKSRRGGQDSANSLFTGSSVQISSFATQAHTEGHEGPLRWLWAGRTTYIKQVVDFLRHQGATDLVLDYYFYDIQGNLAYATGRDAEAMLSVYQGRDQLNFDPFLVDWGNTVIPFNFKWKPSEDWAARSTLSYSLFSQNFGLTSIFKFYNNITTYQAKQILEYSGLDNHRLSLGFEANWVHTVFQDNEYIAKILFRDQTDFALTSLFTQDKWSSGPWEVSSGVRVNYMSKLPAPQAEPRFSVKYSLPARQALDFHTGYYLQYINSILFGDQESINEFYYPSKKVKYQTVKPTSSVLLAAGYSKEGIFDQYDFSLEGYYKSLYDLLIFAPNEKPDSILFDTDRSLGDLFDRAQGYSYGYEASLRRPAGALFGGLSYSHGYSVIREQVYSEPYYPKWHQPHGFKADLAINWKGADGIWSVARKGRYFRSSTQIKYATGLPYTEYTGYAPGHLIDQNEGRSAGGPNPEFEGNLDVLRGGYDQALVPPYFRWDVKPIDWGREGKWNFSFTLLNVTNHNNVFFYTYNREPNPPKRVTITQFPFFPFLLSYEYDF